MAISPGRAKKLREQRKRRIAAHELREQEGLSVREIAERLGAPKSTIADDLKLPKPEPLADPPPNAAGPDNDRATTHGAYSEKVLGPLREQAKAYAAERWPGAPDDKLIAYANLSARVQALSDYELTHGVVRSTVLGDVFPVSNLLSKLEPRLEKAIEALDDWKATAPPPPAERRDFTRVPLTDDVTVDLLSALERAERGSDDYRVFARAMAVRQTDLRRPAEHRVWTPERDRDGALLVPVDFDRKPPSRVVPVPPERHLAAAPVQQLLDAPPDDDLLDLREGVA
jgi:hypothetical protein